MILQVPVVPANVPNPGPLPTAKRQELAPPLAFSIGFIALILAKSEGQEADADVDPADVAGGEQARTRTAVSARRGTASHQKVANALPQRGPW